MEIWIIQLSELHQKQKRGVPFVPVTFANVTQQWNKQKIISLYTLKGLLCTSCQMCQRVETCPAPSQSRHKPLFGRRQVKWGSPAWEREKETEAIQMKKTALIRTPSEERKQLGDSPMKMSCTGDQTTFPQPFSNTKTFPNLQQGDLMLTLPTARLTQLHPYIARIQMRPPDWKTFHPPKTMPVFYGTRHCIFA